MDLAKHFISLQGEWLYEGEAGLNEVVMAILVVEEML